MLSCNERGLTACSKISKNANWGMSLLFASNFSLSSRCKFDGHTRDCSKLFEAHITDEGQCCSFNMMPEYMIFNEEIVSLIFFKYNIFFWIDE